MGLRQIILKKTGSGLRVLLLLLLLVMLVELMRLLRLTKACSAWEEADLVRLTFRREGDMEWLAVEELVVVELVGEDRRSALRISSRRAHVLDLVMARRSMGKVVDLPFRVRGLRVETRRFSNGARFDRRTTSSLGE